MCGDSASITVISVVFYALVCVSVLKCIIFGESGP